VQERIAKEIQHGRFLAQHGAGEIWNWESPAGKLRWARRVKMLSSHLRPGMTVLELGCGTGTFTQELARSGADVIAIDVSAELLEIARANHSAPNIHYQNENAYALSYPDAAFDSAGFYIFCPSMAYLQAGLRRGGLVLLKFKPNERASDAK